MEMIYLAHPVRPMPGSTETVESNLRDAEWWLCALQRANPDVAFAAQWVLDLRLGIGDDSNPEHRRIGLERCLAVAQCCTGIAICGPRIGSGSLAETRSHASNRHRFGVIHRFGRRDQVLVLPPRHRLRSCDFSAATPSWLTRCLFGAAPQSIKIVGAEILAAIEREAVTR
jgi:hypothetical protein